MEDKIRIDYSFVLKEAIGETGLSLDDILKHSEDFLSTRETILSMHERGEIGFLELPEKYEVVDEIINFVENLKFSFRNLLILGIGGSSLGIQAIFQALLPYYNNSFSEKRYFFLENVDPDITREFYEKLSPEESLAVVITKSGSTAETMSHFLILKDFFEKTLKDKANERIIAITDPEKGDLLKIAKENGYKRFAIPQNIGGRFSVLTPVGLLPSALMGISIRGIIRGAKFEKDRFLDEENIEKSKTGLLSSILFEFFERNRNIFVLMPYSSRLYLLSDWFRQLWAESLGKKYKKNGELIYWGQTPVKALGAVDQHSQVQLYIEGPQDKVVGFIDVRERSDLLMPELSGYSSTEYLSGKNMRDLIDCERRATSLALTKEGRPNFTFLFNDISEETIGAFFMLMEIVTALTGEYIGINTYDQPGVELGKKLTNAFMGRSGYSLDLIKDFLSLEGKHIV